MSYYVRLVKAMVFPVVMYGCEGWTVKKAERRRIDAFELWCWRRLLSPLDCKEIQPVHSEGDQPRDFFGRTDGVFHGSGFAGRGILTSSDMPEPTQAQRFSYSTVKEILMWWSPERSS